MSENKDAATAALDVLELWHRSTEGIIDKLKPLFGPNSFDAGLINPVFEQQSEALAAIAEKLGLDIEALKWQVHENEFGKRGHEVVCTITGFETVILSNAEFVAFEMRDIPPTNSTAETTNADGE